MWMWLSDLLVCCIEEQSPFDDGEDIATLFGYVFALYSAYSVQLGTPKHKIDVDPRSWTALMSIECVATGLGTAATFPQACSEVLLMLQTLVYKENAFLKCLRGFGHQFRAKSGRIGQDAKRDLSSNPGPVSAGIVSATLVRERTVRVIFSKLFV